LREERFRWVGGGGEDVVWLIVKEQRLEQIDLDEEV